ncbi:hypothetical protein [Streptomyces roseolus]|uniref:hypothetical protein n=1 Tax=Streptomyces roseolus TaxID=67358 RepID=UPI0016744FD3|nr:hypothetical protein [Streptomyces roseolus]GGR36605.1 hypothetical protein GCM10010282_31380 [Streptomyces roseolus]
MHLIPMGELDWDTGPALDDVSAALGDDMRHLPFADVIGTHRLLACPISSRAGASPSTPATGNASLSVFWV